MQKKQAATGNSVVVCFFVTPKRSIFKKGVLEYMTQAGYDKLKKEWVDALAQRPLISAAIAEARDMGDHSENAEHEIAAGNFFIRNVFFENIIIIFVSMGYAGCFYDLIFAPPIMKTSFVPVFLTSVVCMMLLSCSLKKGHSISHAGIGPVKIGATVKSLPKSVPGLYDKLEIIIRVEVRRNGPMRLFGLMTATGIAQCWVHKTNMFNKR